MTGGAVKRLLCSGKLTPRVRVVRVLNSTGSVVTITTTINPEG